MTYEEHKDDANPKSYFIRHLEEAVSKLSGYADGDDWPIAPELADIAVVKDLYRSAGSSLGQRPRYVRPIDADPPDIVVTTPAGKRIGYELTQLRDGRYTAFHRHVRKNGLPDGWDHIDIIHTKAQWDIERIASEAKKALLVKDKKLARVYGDYDEMRVLIHTCEPDIYNHKLIRAVPLIAPTVYNIDQAWIMIASEPVGKRRVRPAIKIPIIRV